MPVGRPEPSCLNSSGTFTICVHELVEEGSPRLVGRIATSLLGESAKKHQYLFIFSGQYLSSDVFAEHAWLAEH